MATSSTSNPAGSPNIKDVTPRPAAEQAKPAQFEGLASKLAQVPKSELDEKRQTA